MKKIVSLTGIMVLAAIITTSAFAGHVDVGNSTSTTPSMSAALPTDPAEPNVLADHSYSEYGYYSDHIRGGHRTGHRGGNRTGHQDGHR